MRQLLLTPVTPLFEFDFTLNKLLVLFRPIVGARSEERRVGKEWSVIGGFWVMGVSF